MFKKEQLVKLGVDKLADIILSLSQNKADVQKELKVILAGLESDSEKIIKIVKKEVASLKRCNRFINYHESDSFANKINLVRNHIMENLLPKSPNEAAKFLQSLLDSHEDILEQCDDSKGVVGNVFEQICADLGTAYERDTNSSNEDIVKIVYDRFLSNNYGIYGNIICDFKGALGDEGLKKLKQKLEQTSNQKYDSKIKMGLQTIADCQNDVDAYIQVCASSGKFQAHDHLEIARRYIQNSCGKEAIQWLDSIDNPETLGVQESRLSLKVQALKLCGDFKGAQEERLKWFDVSLSPKVYNQILKYGNASFNESWKNTAIQKAFMFSDSLNALKFLIEIKEFEQAGKLVCQKIDDFDGNNYYTIRPIADKLCEIDPLAATLLYRKMIEPILEGVKSRYYHFAAKDLVVCQILSSKITDWRGHKSHELYFEDLSVQHKRKTSFWPEYKLALNKHLRKNN